MQAICTNASSDVKRCRSKLKKHLPTERFHSQKICNHLNVKLIMSGGLIDGMGHERLNERSEYPLADRTTDTDTVPLHVAGLFP